MSARAMRLHPPKSPDIARGHEIAIAMLAYLECDPDVTAARSCLDPEFRHVFRKRAYENIVLTKLQEARACGPEVEAGFTMILSDFLAVCAQGAVPDAGSYEELAERGIIASVQASEPKGAP